MYEVRRRSTFSFQFLTPIIQTLAPFSPALFNIVLRHGSLTRCHGNKYWRRTEPELWVCRVLSAEKDVTTEVC